jgi:hypothetical protein
MIAIAGGESPGFQNDDDSVTSRVRSMTVMSPGFLMIACGLMHAVIAREFFHNLAAPRFTWILHDESPEELCGNQSGGAGTGARRADATSAPHETRSIEPAMANSMAASPPDRVMSKTAIPAMVNDPAMLTSATRRIFEIARNPNDKVMANGRTRTSMGWG